MPPMTTDRGGRRADGTGVSQPRVRMAVALLALALYPKDELRHQKRDFRSDQL